MKKYKINMRQLEEKGGCDRLLRDGFSKLDINRAITRETHGCNAKIRDNIMGNLFHQDRPRGK